MSKNYHPEAYWSDVAKRISDREEHNVIAGDDEPYYRYKRKRFLELLTEVDFKGKSVLEIGCGPGGNLEVIHTLQPSRLVGVDISNNMVELARKNVPASIEVIKIDGTTLPFEDNTFDIVFTATVLQHNTDEEMLKQIISEISRVSKDRVFLFERIESEITGDELCLGRPISYYSNLVSSKENFTLISKKFINIRASYYASGIARKVFSPKTRKEGEPLSSMSLFLQNLSLPVTKILDRVFTSSKDIARLEYSKVNR